MPLYASKKRKGLASVEAREVYVDEIRRAYGVEEFTMREYRAKFGLSVNAAETRLGSLVAVGLLFWRPRSIARRGGRGVANARAYSLVEREFVRQGETEERIYARRVARYATVFETRPFAIKDALKVERARREPLTRYLKPFRVGWGRYQFTERFVVDAYEALDRKDETAIEGAKLLGADAERYAVVKKRRDWLRDDPFGRAVDALKTSQNRERLDIIEAMLRESDKTNETLAKRLGVESAWYLLEPLLEAGLVAHELEETNNGGVIAFYWWDSEIRLADVWEKVDSDPFIRYWKKERAEI